MKTTNIWKWYLVAFQIVSICFCLLALHSSRWWIKKHGQMTNDTAESLEKFKLAYATADSDRKTLLTAKTVKFVVDENNITTQANTSANLEIQDAVEGAMVINVLALTCMFFLEIKKRGHKDLALK